ncbi:hypothetical protein TD95_000100 [Thielaviopsis punctulata]|uniref:REM-1 domain-containing protein n=1 Tax=Thielaviopsis punctulata TaxID=72032 RepID=A0A0F4Z7D4_9PEZI|nr:hypothetical protein TD95_000100 [Thielaviopsis punctulata]
MLDASSATPTQKAFPPITLPSQQNQSPSSTIPPRPSLDGSIHTNASTSSNSGLHPGGSLGSVRHMMTSSSTFTQQRNGSNATGPGSYSSDFRAQMLTGSARTPSRMDNYTRGGAASITGGMLDDEDDSAAEQRIASLKDALNREMKIREGSENMLEALNTKKAKQTKEQRQRVEAELNASTVRINDLRKRIEEAQRQRLVPGTPNRTRGDALMSSVGFRSPRSVSRSRGGVDSDIEEITESPSVALSDLVQALEVDGQSAEYYVSRSNSLVELFKRHPTLKYDLVWHIFGKRIQIMLLSESREVVAAGYRMTRYAISDLASLRKIRHLNTDFLIVSSLVKDRKADVEREQALKLVRAFLDIKDGVTQISRAIVRTIASIAENADERRGGNTPAEPAQDREDRLRPMCIETLAEILLRDPQLLVASHGIAPLFDALSEGSYKAPSSLISVFLYLLDSPKKRQFLRPGYGIDVLFNPFTDLLNDGEALLKQNAKAITLAMKSWSGLMSLTMYNFRTIRSLLDSLISPYLIVKETIIDILYTLLRIKSPGWAQSFLAGRRLTTYGRVTTLKSEDTKTAPTFDEDGGEQNFVDHFTALLLAVLIKAGLLTRLIAITQTKGNDTLTRKTTLLITETLKLASRLLPASWSAEVQLLPDLFANAVDIGNPTRYLASGVVYQISSVSRTLYRSGGSSITGFPSDFTDVTEHPKNVTAVATDEGTFRQMLIDSNVLNSSNYSKWKWDIILKIVEGPLHIGKRVDEALKASKFLKRLMSFYRPFKYRFSEIKNTRNTQKYVKVGCALMHALLQSPEGNKVLSESKLLRQLAISLAQCDPTSVVDNQHPIFSKDRLIDTLCGGYFPMLGVLSGDPRGLRFMERLRIFTTIYHVIDHNQRSDIIKLLLSNFDYSIAGHPRVILSKALTGGTKEIRIHASNVLRKYAVHPASYSPASNTLGDSKWAIELLVTQLYDVELEVCATAVKILEKACSRKAYLEYIVYCRPSLDHLGEIGAPLLLRFLSTSSGYQYLNGLDYISNEMDDWFLGRNDTYVDLIEASLARAFLEPAEEQQTRPPQFDQTEAEGEFNEMHVPPHFYRELTRTSEGCKLLRDKGHFDEFVATIREFGMQSEDPELVVKVKGCLWAVGNIGSMELGAPFLESCDVVEQIVEIAQHHEILSLRGTAFFVLGLISRSIHGLEILTECGWESATSITGASYGLCVPKDLSKFFSLRPWHAERIAHIDLPVSQRTMPYPPPAMPPHPPLEDDMPLPTTPQEAEDRVVQLVVDLSNTVLFKRAMNALMQLKQHSPGCFYSITLYKKVHTLLEYSHYRFPIRKMVIELFPPNVVRSVVFENTEEDDDSDTQDEDDREIRAQSQTTQSLNQSRRQSPAKRQMRKNSAVAMRSDDLDDMIEEEETRRERVRSVSDPSYRLNTLRTVRR